MDSSQSTHELLPYDTSEVPGSRTSRALYFLAQLQAYFTRISLNKKHLSSPIFDGSPLAEHGMPVLAALFKHHQVKIHFKNLNLYCYPAPLTTLDVQNIYKMVVANGRGRGGPCVTVNSVSSSMLRTQRRRESQINASAHLGVEDSAAFAHILCLNCLGSKAKIR